MDSKRKWKWMFFFCLLVLLGCLLFRIFYTNEQEDNLEIYEQLKEEKKQIKTFEEEKVHEESTEEEEEETAPIEIPVNFSELQELNPDIYSWIEIPDTQVDYPIAQSAEDELYYLDHTVEGVKGYPGSIYTENLNKKDFTDKNTVIYGHNMNNGSMFGELYKYVDGSYMEEHPYIVIYTPEHIYTYEIFAAVTYDNRHILDSYDFGEEEEYQKFLDTIYHTRNMGSYIREDIKVSVDDRILTLSTCVANQDQQRFLVEAVLVDEK